MFASESSAIESGPQTSFATCKFYNANKGHCRYGERCRFVHQFDYNDLNIPKHRTADAKRSDSQDNRRNPIRRHQRPAPDPTRARSWRNKNHASFLSTNDAGLNGQPTYEAPPGNADERQSTSESKLSYPFQQPSGGIGTRDRHDYRAGVTFRQDHDEGRSQLSDRIDNITLGQADVQTADGSQIERKKGRTHSRVCSYFVRGFCKKGDNCEFAHRPSDAAHSRRVCQFYRRGFCRKGERCHFAHTGRPESEGPQNDMNRHQPGYESNVSEEDNEIFAEYDHQHDAGMNHYGVPVGEENSDSEEFHFQAVNSDCPDDVSASVENHPALVSSDDPNFEKTENNFRSKEQLRDIEISMLQKRFPKDDLQQLDEQSFVVNLAATDPDWPYDIRNVKMMISFEANYPEVPPIVEVREKDNSALPSNLIGHLSRNVRGWFERQNKLNVESGVMSLLFRPFLRWFDRSLEAMFTEGLRKTKRELEAKAAGLEFVPFENLPGSCDSESVEIKLTKQKEESIERRTSTTINESAVNQTTDATIKSDAVSSETQTMVPLNMNDLMSTNKGTAIKLCNLRLGENVAAVTCQKLAVTVQCTRCKCNNDVRTSPRRRNLVKCGQCAASQFVTFRPSMVHAFDGTLGYLDLDDCRAFDLILVDCIFSVQCLECLKQLSTDGIHYGQPWFTWCHSCNTKLEMYIGSPKFQILQPNKARNKGPVDLIKTQTIKKVKNPSIQEGKPLPDCGTCKHYKKSYRWFRFPCCGKAYPCDLCHNEKELEHEMKLANRVICGYCAKEQPYTGNKPCLGCTLSMTNLNRGHWEGGKGCRDKVKMSRDDKQKYVGMAKTVPKKVKDQKEIKK